VVPLLENSVCEQCSKDISILVKEAKKDMPFEKIEITVCAIRFVRCNSIHTASKDGLFFSILLIRIIYARSCNCKFSI
jgi:hypothetical protein